MEDWNLLSEPAQLSLASAALRQASESLAEYAELLAEEMYLGSVSDRGGPEALRLFAAMVRNLTSSRGTVAGHA